MNVMSTTHGQMARKGLYRIQLIMNVKSFVNQVVSDLRTSIPIPASFITDPNSPTTTEQVEEAAFTRKCLSNRKKRLSMILKSSV